MSNKVKAKSMKKDAKTELKPRLRFPEFRDAGGWAKPKLGSLGIFTGGGTPSKDNASYWEGVNPWVSSSDISEDNIYEIKINRFISDNAIQETATKIVPENSILLVSRVGVGKLAITKEKICTSQDFTSFTPSKDNLVFLAYCLKAMKETFLSFNQGMAIKGFTKDDASNVKIPLPVKPKEQQKIADCLSTIDNLITAESQKLNSLKTHKKGLMQQLFSREGATLPRLRFPEFRDAGEWEEVTLSTQVDLISGLHLAPDEYANTGEVPYFTGPSDYVNDLALVSKWTVRGANAGCAGDTLITVKGSGVGELLYLVLDEVAMGRQLMAVRPRSVHGGFVFHFLATQRQRLVAFASGNLIPGLSRGDILGLNVSVPKRDEQKRIADCLSSLDDLIAVQTQKIERLKTHKKGLMQQIFPVMESLG